MYTLYACPADTAWSIKYAKVISMRLAYKLAVSLLRASSDDAGYKRVRIVKENGTKVITIFRHDYSGKLWSRRWSDGKIFDLN